MTENYQTQNQDITLAGGLDIVFALKAARLGVWDYNPSTNLVNWDDRCRELFGLAKDNLIGYERAIQYIHPDDKDRVTMAVQRALDPQSGGEYDVTYRTIGADDGVLRYVRFTGQTYFDEAGTAYRLGGVARDVTNEVLTQHRLEATARQASKESEERFRTMAEDSDILIAMSDENGQSTYLNSEWTKLTGRSVADLLNRGWVDLVHPDDRDAFLATYGAALAKQESFSGEFRMLSQQGEYRWLLVRCPARFRPDGTFAGYISSGVDITERKQAEEALRASEQRFQAAVQAVQGILWTNNAAGEMEGEQPGWAALTGQTHDEYQGYGWTKAVHPDDVQPTIDAWREALQETKMFVFQHRVRLQDGEWGQFSIRAIPLLKPDGSIREWVGVHTDITKQQAAEQTLRESQERQTFLLRLSDAIRPLNDPVDIQQYAIQVLGEQLRADRVGYAEDQADDTVVVTRHYVRNGSNLEGRHRYEDYGSELLRDLQAGRTVIRHDIENDPTLTPQEKARHKMLELGATVNVPLLKNGRLVAILFAHFNQAHFWTPEEVSLIHEVAERTWEAVERARVEVALRNSEARFRTLIEEAPVSTMLMTGPNHIIELANAPMIQMLGRDAGILGKPAVEAVPELAHQPFLDLLNGVYSTGVAQERKAMPGELVKEGVVSTHYFDFTYKPMFDSKGQVYGVLSMAVDVTQQIEATRRIQQNQQQLLALFEQAPVAIAIVEEKDLTFRMVNPFYGDLVGRAPSELVNKPLFEALPEIQGQGFDELLRGVIQTGIPYVANEIAVDIVRNDQLETMYVDLVYQPWRETDEGQISGVFVVATDVTQQVQSRRRVEASEAKLWSIVSTAPVAICLFMGRDLVIEIPNQTFIDIVGKSPDIVGKPLRVAVPELTTQNQPFLQLLDDVYTTGKQFRSYGSLAKIERQGVMTSNYYNVAYTPLFDEKEEVYAILAIAVDVTGQILAQQELDRQKSYLENALNIADIGTYEIHIDAQKVNFSDKFGNWFGLPNNEATAAEVLSKIHPDDLKTVNQIVGDASSPEPWGHDITYRVNNGIEETYVRSLGRPRFVDGKPVSIIGVLQNVTPQVLARRELEASEDKFRSLIEQAPVATGLYVGPDRIVEVANDTMLSYWGRNREVIGLPLMKALPELEGQPFMDLLEQVYTSGVAHNEKSARADLIVDGKMNTYYFDYTYKPIRSVKGEIVAIMNMAVDVTDEVISRRRLEEAEATLRGAIELAELVTWRLDIERGTITYSKRFMDWLGFSEDTKALDEAFNPLPEEYRQSVADALAATWQPGATGFYENEHPIINRLTGQVRIIHAQAEIQYDSDGKPVFLNGTARDVTQERQQQQELERQVQERTQQLQMLIVDLERSNQNLQQFAYVASHDLQEPLRKIQSFGDLLANQYKEPLGDGVDFLRRMQSAAVRMSVLIKDLLTFSRISTRQEVSEPVSLDRVVRSVLSDLEIAIAEAGAVVEIAPLPTLSGDRSQLGQLFQNLLSNALKFRQKDQNGDLINPRIQISAQRVELSQLPSLVRPTRQASAYQRIDVADNGIGFDAKYADRIFQVFQRLHSKSEFAGTGIGLAICEKVAANHGGAITATSEPGKGATFSVYLPE